MTRLGDFWKFMRTKFLAKVAQIFINILDKYLATFLDKCEKWHVLCQTDVYTFWAKFGVNWATFYSSIWSLCLLLHLMETISFPFFAARTNLWHLQNVESECVQMQSLSLSLSLSLSHTHTHIYTHTATATTHFLILRCSCNGIYFYPFSKVKLSWSILHRARHLTAHPSGSLTGRNVNYISG